MMTIGRSACLIGLVTTLCLRPGLAQESMAPDFYVSDPQLETYIGQALDANPWLRQALSRYSAATLKISQVTAMPDPEVTFTQFVRSVETRVGPQQNSLMLSQRFPWFGKLDLQGKAALREASAIYEQYRAFGREVAARVKDTFYEIGYVDRAIEIVEEEQFLLQHYEQLAETRYATGQGPQQAVIRLQAEITKTMHGIHMLMQQRTSLEGRLNTLRDRPPGEPIPAIIVSELPQVDLDLAALFELGEANRPELLGILDSIEKEELTAERARKDYWPDVTVSAGLVNVGGRDDPAGRAAPPSGNSKNVFSVSVGINIPLRRDKYRAEVLAAGERRRAEREGYDYLVADMKFEIHDQVNRLETIRTHLALYDDAAQVQAESALRAAETGYQTGQLGALDLLDSERMLLDIKMNRERLVFDYMQALARLELALGTRFPNP